MSLSVLYTKHENLHARLFSQNAKYAFIGIAREWIDKIKKSSLLWHRSTNCNSTRISPAWLTTTIATSATTGRGSNSAHSKRS